MENELKRVSKEALWPTHNPHGDRGKTHEKHCKKGPSPETKRLHVYKSDMLPLEPIRWASNTVKCAVAVLQRLQSEPSVLCLIGNQKPHDDRARYLKRIAQDARFQSLQGHRLSWDLPSLSLVPPRKRMNSSHHKFRYHLLCTFQPTKHLPLQGCNKIGTIRTSGPDLSRKKQLSMHITSHHNITFQTIRYNISYSTTITTAEGGGDTKRGRESITHPGGTVCRCKTLSQMSDETQTRCNPWGWMASQRNSGKT